MRLLKLPSELRGELRKGFGSVVSGSDYRSVALRVVEVVGSCGRVWAVGDIVCHSLVGVGCTPKVCFIDGKTLRAVGIDTSGLLSVFSEVLRIRNPAGTISEEAISVVKYCADKDGVLVLVDGEEDLIGLAVLLHARFNEYLVYGLPMVGVDVVKIDASIKKTVSELLSRFEVVPFDTNGNRIFRQNTVIREPPESSPVDSA